MAEIYSLAYQRQWQEKKRNQLGNLLFAFQTLPIARRAIIDNYVRIDAYSQGKDPDRPLPIGMTARNMGKNDLWIAATAHEIGASLVTTDKDFHHLQDVFMSIISPYS